MVKNNIPTMMRPTLSPPILPTAAPPPWRPHNEPPRLRFAPLAWMKLQLFLHAGETEVGGFGIGREEDLLYVEDFVTVRQQVSAASVAFDDGAVADYFDDCVDRLLKPQQFGRIWLHTHPGASPQPSGTDEQTFARVFGRCDWSVMFIIGRTGRTYARLRFSAGPGGSIELPVEVDWASWPGLLMELDGRLDELTQAWMDEYGLNIHPVEAWPASGLRVDAWEPERLARDGDRHLFSERDLYLDELALAGEEEVLWR